MYINTEFVPADLDATSWETIEPYFKRLQDRPVDSLAELERWLLDRSELEAACRESRANLYISMTCDTDNKPVQQAYERYIQDVAPKLKPVNFALDRRQVELSTRFGLTTVQDGRYRVLDRNTRAEVELYRDENVPLQTELSLLAQKYNQTIGAMTVHFDGAEQTLPQMGRYAEAADRAVREAAWRAVAARRAQDAALIDNLYDSMISLRDRMGRNAGFAGFTEYAFRSMLRFDYGVAQCEAFHKGVEQHVVPLVRRMDERRRAALKLAELRPWDLAVDPRGRPALRPFNGGRELVAKAHDTFSRLSPKLAAMFAELGDGSNTRGPADGACLDLDSRKGKAPGGYQYMRDRRRTPFIFMNAAGLHRDVATMLHEAGHAFHSILSRHEPLVAYRESPTEFAEVASMTMEYVTMPHWESFYPSPEDLGRARRQQLEDAIVILPWIATIDAFQHWVYAHPGHTPDQRRDFWLSLDERFGRRVSWQGLEETRGRLWQRQLHLFDYPFYYIEYGIAQLGAMTLWVRSLEESPDAAINAYCAGLSLGGSRPLPELFRAAGLKFDFGPDAIARVVERVDKELAALPE